MQGITRDTAMAQKLWEPKVDTRIEAEIPDRDDPGEIEVERKRERNSADRGSGNKKDTELY